jgi:hypothetical protein
MSNQTWNLVVHSTAEQRFSPAWHRVLEDILLGAGVAPIDVGGGTDLSTNQSDNDYEITGSEAALERALTSLRSNKYSFAAFTQYSDEPLETHYV